MDYSNRISRLRELLTKQDLEGVLIDSIPNYVYFSGFNGDTAYLFVTLNNAYIIVDSRFTVQASEQKANVFSLIEYSSSIYETIKEICNTEKIKKIGIEGNRLSFSFYYKLKNTVNLKEINDIGEQIDFLRASKEKKEIELIKKAVEISDYAFSQILSVIKPGVSELDIAAEIEYYMKKQGAKGPSFETIVASGSRSAMPHGVASSKKIENGDAIVMDFGCVFGDYCSDMTRTVFVGKVNEELKKIYDIVFEAQKKGIESVQSEIPCNQIDNSARKVIEAKGYGKFFGHSLGHGVGIEIHESPTVSSKNKSLTQSGMIITIEPGIYIEGLGGVRIEDMVLVNDKGAEILTSSNKNLISII